ncbi:radical SAM protein [Desulfococcus sp.]|jgi:biotin synthase|uniref:radical SAM protein n=1 Tax=Desulfococcus sp. TaxID=2025834 RepID=UPI0035946E83
MSWKIAQQIAEILKKGADFAGITRDEALLLMKQDLHTREVCALMQTADQMSREQFGGKGENHLHIGVNIEPCPFDCSFCSLTRQAGIFTQKIEFSEAEILAWACAAESSGADALNVMTTGTFSFERLLEIGRLLKKTVSTPLVANTRDVTHKEAEALLSAGFEGAYHAVRLGEGRDTPFNPEKRVRTIGAFGDVGLRWMNCVEPVGPEHPHEEIVDLMLLARTHRAAYSGVMRRINFPGSPMEKYGMITELEMARMVAVSRLVMGSVPRAHCTHEPHTASLLAGANLFFPEVGSSPRDGQADTGKGRGRGIAACRAMQMEMEWNPNLPSNCFGDRRDRG